MVDQKNALKPYSSASAHTAINPHAAGRSWFKVSELASLYNIPSPTSEKVVVGVVSFGGGLVGSVDSYGVLTNGDVQSYWSYLGIAPENMPTVMIKPIAGATNNPGATDGSTDENTLDVETIGGCCPTSNLTIIMYIAPNSLSSFVTLFNYMLNTPVMNSNGEGLLPSIISVSWGAPESYYTNLNAINALFATAVLRGINICVASGDNGSSDGLRGTNLDFPSSSPNVIAVGGTHLVSTENTYSSQTVETAWSSGGGGISKYFAKPAYQSALTGSFRYSPDVSLNADPNTGVIFYINGSYVVYGGTSVSAPTMAGFLASINSTTFANPRMYATTQNVSFHDIVSGNNGAFTTKTGYDSVTGLGSIKGGALANVLSLPISVSSVTFAASSVAINVGSTIQITANVLPLTASNKALTWTTSNAQVATVSSSGVVTGVSNGSAQIRATTVDGGLTANAIALVSTSVTGVSLNATSITLRRNQAYQFTATISPSTASVKTTTWLSSVAARGTLSVQANNTALFTARTIGTTTVQVKTTNGGFLSSCRVTITA